MHLILQYVISNTDCIQNSTTQNKDMRIVCMKTENFIGRLQWHDLLSRDSAHFLSGLAVMKRSSNGFRPMVNIEMPHAVGNYDKREIRCTDAELALLFWRLDVAECIKGADVLPADWRRGVGAGNFRLPDKAINVVSEAEGWHFVGGQQRVEQPLITARVHLHLHIQLWCVYIDKKRVTKSGKKCTL